MNPSWPIRPSQIERLAHQYMGYRNLNDCINNLRNTNQLIVIDQEVSPYLEAAAIQRRVYESKGPALLFRNVSGCAFPMAANLFGTVERARYLFRDALESAQTLAALKVHPQELLKRPGKLFKLAPAAWRLLPRFVSSGPILAHRTTVSQLPQLHSWPDDGGAFVTLPQVYTEDPDRPGPAKSNLGMYRVQLSGNDYAPDQEVGLHYQIHRGIGIHHSKAIQRGEPLRVNVIVGGPPALAFAAVMPLPEGLPELSFAGILGGRRMTLVRAANGLPMPAESDFVISGYVDPDQLKPEGPFGDHLGYYSLKHDFPVLKVDAVHHRPGAIWPFTSVGRPPQEDTTFGEFIHELTASLAPTVWPGVHAVHAVDAAGVHPLLLAVGSERYAPYAATRRPQELLTQANAILGIGQTSLAKYLWITARQDDPDLNIHHIPEFFRHMLERVDWNNDLHFHTRTTIDTLDYSGDDLNSGSKVVIAATGPKRRELPTEIPGGLTLPEGFGEPRLAMPGALVVQSPRASRQDGALRSFCERIAESNPIRHFPLIVLVDDAEFSARTLRNFIWTTFTRSNPAADIDGIDAFTDRKHWGCRGPLVIDARIKPHHAPPLIDDPKIERKVDALGAPGGPLHKII